MFLFHKTFLEMLTSLTLKFISANNFYSIWWLFLQVQHWLNELCEELSERLRSDLDQNKRIAHTLTLHARAYKVPIFPSIILDLYILFILIHPSI